MNNRIRAYQDAVKEAKKATKGSDYVAGAAAMDASAKAYRNLTRSDCAELWPGSPESRDRSRPAGASRKHPRKDTHMPRNTRQRPHWPGRRVKAVKGRHRGIRGRVWYYTGDSTVLVTSRPFPWLRARNDEICADHLRQRWI